MMFTHTPESDKIIRDGYARLASVHSIAKKLGITRDAVIGRARRIGLSDPQNNYLSTPRKGEAHAKRWGRA